MLSTLVRSPISTYSFFHPWGTENEKRRMSVVCCLYSGLVTDTLRIGLPAPVGTFFCRSFCVHDCFNPPCNYSSKHAFSRLSSSRTCFILKASRPCHLFTITGTLNKDFIPTHFAMQSIVIHTYIGVPFPPGLDTWTPPNYRTVSRLPGDDSTVRTGTIGSR